MATNPYKRLVFPDVDIEDKIPVHVFYSALPLLVRGNITAQQFNALCGTDMEDLQPGGQVRQLAERIAMASTDRAQWAATRDIWTLTCLAEWDVGKDNVLKLHSITNFVALMDAIVAHHDSIWT